MSRNMKLRILIGGIALCLPGRFRNLARADGGELLLSRAYSGIQLSVQQAATGLGRMPIPIDEETSQDDKPIDPKRKAKIEALLSDWAGQKSKAEKMVTLFLKNIKERSEFNYDDFKSHLDKAMSLSADIEKREQKRLKKMKGVLDELLSSGRISAQEKEKREKALTAIIQLRMLYVYGNLLPRILDESVVINGQRSGKQFAGSDWKIQVTEEEFKKLQSDYISASGFSKEDLDGEVK